MATSAEGSKPAVKVFVATTVMLTFISFWRAAAIVLSDLASSAYYAGGDAEKVIGKSAPWFILAVMLFSYCVRALYIESSAMFVRGGVYRVVKEAMGGIVVAVYFWWKNIQGIHESSQKAVQIMIITTVMVVILLLWCTVTVFK